ncbi:MAG: hypothetical protein HZA68_07655 [Rhodovulum sp.]|nr:hypothetical protein [Rhodovulum sp.]
MVEQAGRSVTRAAGRCSIDRVTTIALTAYVLAVGTLLAVALPVLWGAS